MRTEFKKNKNTAGNVSRAGTLHPVAMMIWAMIAALCMTYFIDSGRFERESGQVVPGTYQAVPKSRNPAALFAISTPKGGGPQAAPASIASVFIAVPRGLIKNAPLIFMVMFIGGMFGVMQRTGALDAGINRLLHLTAGNIKLLTPLLMALIGLGSTFLGFISEYLVIHYPDGHGDGKAPGSI